MDTTRRTLWGWMALTLVLLTPQTQAEDASPPSAEPKGLPTIAFPCAWDAREGKLWLEVGRFDTDFFCVESLAAGVRSNDTGLGRGQVGGSHVVRFVRGEPRCCSLSTTCVTAP